MAALFGHCWIYLLPSLSVTLVEKFLDENGRAPVTQLGLLCRLSWLRTSVDTSLHSRLGRHLSDWKLTCGFSCLLLDSRGDTSAPYTRRLASMPCRLADMTRLTKFRRFQKRTESEFGVSDPVKLVRVVKGELSLRGWGRFGGDKLTVSRPVLRGFDICRES